MNGVVYADDSQVVCMELVKRWSVIPGTRVRVSEFMAVEDEAEVSAGVKPNEIKQIEPKASTISAGVNAQGELNG